MRSSKDENPDYGRLTLARSDNSEIVDQNPYYLNASTAEDPYSEIVDENPYYGLGYKEETSYY